MMTPALKAMVEVMGAEMQRQAEIYDPSGEGGFAHDTGRQGEWHVGGRFDLEKVARAGLGALAALDGEAGGIFEQADQLEVYGTPIDMGQLVFDTVLGEILKVAHASDRARPYP